MGAQTGAWAAAAQKTQTACALLGAERDGECLTPPMLSMSISVGVREYTMLFMKKEG